MNLYEALLLITAIADEGQKEYQEEYDNGNVDKALKKIDEFVRFIVEEG